MTYKNTRVCKECQHEDVWTFSKREAAFDLFDVKKIYDAVCTQCGKIAFGSLVQERPNIDQELMNEWAVNENLFFFPQDEDLMIADPSYVPFILTTIDHPETLMVKRQLLINVLCILVYNYDYSLKNSPEAEDRISKEKNMEALLEELNKRKALVLESEEWIMDYAKRIVFPKLRLAWRAPD